MYIWHNTRGSADQYFICEDGKVIFQIPKLLGRVIDKWKDIWYNKL